MISLHARHFVAITLLIALSKLPAAFAQQPHDLKMIADQSVIALWASPDQLLKNQAAAELFKAIVKAAPEADRANIAATVPKIDSFKMSMTPGKRMYSDNETPIPVMVMHLSDAAAAKTMFEQMTKNYKSRMVPELSVPLYQYEFPQFKDSEGKPEEDNWILQPGTAQLDPQTLANGMTAEKLIAVAKAKGPATAGTWASDFKSLASSQGLLLIDTVKLRVMLEEEFKRRPPRENEAKFVNGIKPLYEESEYALLALDTNDGLKLTGLAKSPTPEAALRFKGALEGTVAMAKGLLPVLKVYLFQVKLYPAESIDKVYKELETAVNGLTITQDGTTTKLSLHIKQDCVNSVVAVMVIPLLEEQQRQMEAMRERYQKEVEKAIKPAEIPEAKE